MRAVWMVEWAGYGWGPALCREWTPFHQFHWFLFVILAFSSFFEREDEQPAINEPIMNEGRDWLIGFGGPATHNQQPGN